jgi:hypothetical protein
MIARIFFSLLVSFMWMSVSAQKIVYSEPDREDGLRLDFEIVGKLNGNFLIYKNIRNKRWIVGLDNDMKQVFKEEQNYLPSNERLINTEFFAYPDFAYMLYQYQRKNVIYCMASKIGSDGKQIGKEIELDTTHISFAADNKIYTVVSSEDKSKIGILKINSRNRRLFVMTTLLFNDKLELQKKSIIPVPMEERNEHLGDFFLDNDGDMVFAKLFRNNNDNINRAMLGIKYAQADSIYYNELNIEKTALDDISIKVDNANKRYLLSSYYYKERRGNVDGYYFYSWDKAKAKSVLETISIFSDELRQEARGDASVKGFDKKYYYPERWGIHYSRGSLLHYFTV